MNRQVVLLQAALAKSLAYSPHRSERVQLARVRCTAAERPMTRNYGLRASEHRGHRDRGIVDGEIAIVDGEIAFVNAEIANVDCVIAASRTGRGLRARQ